jgi:hypothetical protein
MIKRTLIILMLFCGVCSGSPVITSHTVGGEDTQFPIVNNGQDVGYTIMTDVAADYYITIDGTITSTGTTSGPVNSASVIKSFTEPYYHSITFTLNDSGDEYTWYPNVRRETSSSSVEYANETSMEQLQDSLSDSTDFEGTISSSTIPYTTIIGPMFFVAVWGMYFGMAWIRQQNVTIPSIVGLVVGVTGFMFFPSDFMGASISMILVSITALLYNMYKER